MSIAASLAIKLHAADRTGNVLGALELVDHKAFLIVEVLVASLAVVVFGKVILVALHLSDGVESLRTVDIGAAHLAWYGGSHYSW